MDDQTKDTLSRSHKLGLLGLAVFFIAFGVLTEVRSAFLSRRMGDLTVYLRTAWAVRTGGDIYDVTDDNGWHYQYPPVFAILMTPFADPPRDADKTGYVPFAVTAGVWYAFSVLCLFLSVHVMANLLAPPETRRFGRRWWAIRVIPMLALMPPIAQTLMRGQVSILLLFFFAMFLGAWCRGRKVQAGVWLSAAICLKVIPAYLLVYPLVKRDLRCLSGAALGLLVGLVLVPMAVFGPRGTVDTYQHYANVLLLPGVGKGADKSREKELIAVTGTDSQSFLSTMHNTWYLERSTRPPHADPLVRRAHWALGGLLTLCTLLFGWRARSKDTVQSSTALAPVLEFGCLVMLMNLISPVCHFHYFAMSVPVAMGLTAASWTDDVLVPTRLRIYFAWVFLCGVLPVLPGLEVLRDVGLAMYAQISLWACGVFVLAKKPEPMSCGTTLARAA